VGRKTINNQLMYENIVDTMEKFSSIPERKKKLKIMIAMHVHE
jgi:hypothetical protein